MLIAAIGDTGYNSMLLLHVLTAFIGFAPAWLWPILARQVGSGNPQAATNLEVSILRYSLPGLVASGLLGFGVAGMSQKVFRMSQPWLVAAFCFWMALIAIYVFVARPAIAKLRQGNLEARPKLGMATGASHSILVVMLYLMIFKPGL